MSNSIKLSIEGANAITALRHENGTFQYYRNTLRRVKRLILEQSDEIGMSDTEALHTLRVLHSISADLEALRGGSTMPKRLEERQEVIAARVEDTFNDFSESNYTPENRPQVPADADRPDADEAVQNQIQ